MIGFAWVRAGKREDMVNPSWRRGARFQWDTPLVARGDCLDGAAQRLSSVRFDVVYCSPFLRCLQTAQRLLRALGQDDTSVYVHKGLSELHSHQ